MDDHTNDDIAGFFISGWYVFDNFAPFQVEWRGKMYPTSEHAYQAAHFLVTDQELAEQVRLRRSPKEAADFANEHKAADDPDWAAKKITTMEEIVRAKFDQHPYIQDVLRDSSDKYIVEMNDNDAFWGWGADHNGQNELGKIWKRIRSECTS